ncbi:hypothetical protein, partial [Kingella kingae]
HHPRAVAINWNDARMPDNTGLQ